jgi:hypothetical protein
MPAEDAIVRPIAAMAPGTNIGAAHPLQVTGTPLPSRQPQPSAPEETEQAPPRADGRQDRERHSGLGTALALAFGLTGQSDDVGGEDGKSEESQTTIHDVVVDLSGELIVDPEAQMRAVMAHQ